MVSDGRNGLMDSGLTPGALVDRAMEATGLDDVGSPHFEQFLEPWCADLASERVSERGRAFLTRQAVRNLETRLRVMDTLRRHTEIEDVPLPPIVRIVGFPRSGTTLLHNLMALRPRARSLLRWELVSPVPPPETETYPTDPRIATIQRSVDALRGTELERLHWVEATDPEECTWGFIDLSGLMARGCGPLMHTWADAIYDRTHSHRETYTEYRKLVQLLLWHNPVAEGGVLILKCPTDGDQLATFLDVFPEAKVVLCHRDPLRTLTSSLRVSEVINTPFLAAGHDLSDAGDAQLRVQAGFADAMVDVAATMGDRLTSVRYADLMDDPGSVVVDAFEALSLPTDRSVTIAAVHRFLTAQRQGLRAPPPEAYGTYGFTPEQVYNHPSMSRYVDAFRVQPEGVRITQPAR